MKLIIAGPRRVVLSEDKSANHLKARRLVIDALDACGWRGDIHTVITGGAAGIDTAAHQYAMHYWHTEVMQADWDKYGKSAGMIRNKAMAVAAGVGGSGALLAIWDGQSWGTVGMIEIARKSGLRVYIHRFKVE